MLPLDLAYLYRHYATAVANTKGKDVLLGAFESESYYLLQSGSYVLVVYTNDSGEEKDFNVVLATDSDAEIDYR